MAIQYPNFPRLTGADMGAFDLGAAIKSGLGNYSAYQEAKFKPKNLAEELLSKQLANKINTPYAQNAQRVFDADIGGKEGNNSLLDYRKQLLQAQAQQAGASADKTKMIANLFSSIMNGDNPMPDNQGADVGSGTPSYQQSLQQGLQGNAQPNNSKDLMRKNLVAHLLGLKPTSQVVNGSLVTNNPLFGLSQQKVGPTSFEKELSRGDAKHVFELEGIAQNAANSQTTLDSLADIVSSAKFDEMRQNPILGSHELGYFSKFGTPEQQNMANQYLSVTGEIVKNAARDFKGQFRVGEQALLNSMKPSPSDTAEGARAKTESLYYMNKMLLERSRISADLIRKGASPLDAYREADKKIDGKALRQSINDRLHKNTKKASNTAVGENVAMMKGGKIYFVPVDKAKEAVERGGFTYAR